MVRPSITPTKVGSPQEALEALQDHTAGLHSLSSNLVLELDSPSRNIRLKGRMSLIEGTLSLDITGPFGIELVGIVMSEDICTVKMHQTGKILEMESDTPLIIPNLPYDLPSPQMLSKLLLPALNLADLQYSLVRFNDLNIQELTLKPVGRTDVDSLRIGVNLDPLRIYREECWAGGEVKYVRKFSYSSQKLLYPDEITIYINDIELKIKFLKIKINRDYSHVNYQTGDYVE